MDTHALWYLSLVLPVSWGLWTIQVEWSACEAPRVLEAWWQEEGRVHLTGSRETLSKGN